MALLDKDHFLLGLFGTNCSSGMSVTKVPERWENSWENNLKVAQMLDDAGIEFMLPVARWIGYGGETNFQGSSLEAVTWATGLTALTKNLNLIVTIHTAVNNPVAVAKQIATMDHISGSRVALNVVAGWNKPEYEALGLDPPAPHEERYAFAKEWIQIVRALWESTESFDFTGHFWKLKHVLSQPRPNRRPIVLNAGGSETGRRFATENTDIFFTPVITIARSKAEVAEIKKNAAEAGRKVAVMTTCYVVCRPTEQEAKDYLDYYVRDNADWEGTDNLVEGLFATSHSFPPETKKHIRYAVAAGHGSWAAVGTPRQVADKLIELHEVGFIGTTLSFVDYIKEFPYFRDEVLPLLEQAGIRKPKRS